MDDITLTSAHLSDDPQHTVAIGDNCIIQAARLACPHCRRALRAHDVEETGGGSIQIICPGCHRDLLVIEMFSGLR